MVKYDATKNDLLKIIEKHEPELRVIEMLAVSANLTGMLVAMQDQRTTTAEKAMKVVAANIELGNQHILEDLLHKTEGNA